MEGTQLLLGPILAPFILGLTTIVLLYWFATRKHGYWKERGVIYDKPLPFFGSLLRAFRKPAQDVEIERYNKYGQVYGHFEGSRPVISIGDPALLKNILVKDFPSFSSRRKFEVGDPVFDKMVSILQGEDWKRVRTIITPTFTTGKIKRMVKIFKECANTCVTNYKAYAEQGKPVDLKKIYGAFTMDIIASSAFSTKLDSHNDPENKFVKAARDVFTRNVSWRFVLFLVFPWIMKYLRISILPPKGINFFKNVTLEIIQERKRTGKKRNDFLQLLMDTADEVQEQEQQDNEKEDLTENYGKDDTNPQVFKSVSNKSLSYNELIAQCIIFFLAGYDTTASTLSFASYLLALNPDVQEKLIAELDGALKASNGELTYDSLQEMKYLDNVISETLRLYPPAVRLERVAEQDYILGDTGITIPKDMVVTIPTCAMHKDPKLFPNPEKFDPDRFSAEERAKRDQYTYMPFGSGPRNCVGMRFALMEIKVCLAFILSNFRVKKCPQTQVPLEFYIGQQLLQPKNVTVQMEIRKDGIRAR
ncbi:cytochrome P450 3A8-like isoform X1 [Uloborus diversus]|uniref:cytochrome P450 3A8-like isoform X1 n=1 Tax=Uloborus diversus TaxID=327109 RepID=UPI002409D70C|nr:cytochrome P450 3A8-like isoform X1 [Uloborus diversus]